MARKAQVAEMSTEVEPTSETGDRADRDAARRGRTNALMVMWALMVIAGVSSAFAQNGSAAAEIFAGLAALVVPIAIATWCYYDARLHDIEIGRAFMVLIILVAIVGFPVYAFRSRGVRGFLLIGYSLLVATALLAFSAGSAIATDLLLTWW